MNLKGKNLVEWLESINPKKGFPQNGKVNYVARYRAIKEFLDNHVHPEIATMTLTFEDDIYLTKHGTEHIDVVIDRLSALVNTKEVKDLELSPYEVYLLLVAAQLHDTGHIKNGRTGHEGNAGIVIDKLGTLLGNEMPEKKIIWSIVDAHGGRTPAGSKDKIDNLQLNESILGIPVRPRILAALLRFADELADDYTRASKILTDAGLLKRESEIFHQYAAALHSVEIDHEGREIKLSYTLTKNQLLTKYGKGKTGNALNEVYLIDEIYERLYKMYKEFIYCMRFIPYKNKFDTISAKISFTDVKSYADFLPPIPIRLTETGYPEMHAKNIFELCPTLLDNTMRIDGAYLMNKIST